MADVPSYPIAVIARLCDLTERHIRRLANEGHITKPEGRGRWPITIVTEYIRYLREKSFGSATASSYHDEKTRLAKEQADEKEMVNKVRRGELAEVAAIEEVTVAVIHATKARILAIPSQISRYLENQTSQNIEAQLHDALYDALAGLSESSKGSPQTTKKVDSKRVGRRRKKVKRRSKRPARKVAN